METQNRDRIARTQEDADLDAALKQVYARYGSDLDAFFRDANKAAERYAAEMQRCVKRGADDKP